MREKYYSVLFILPCIIVILTITIFPLLYSLGISFTNIELGRPWLEFKIVGFQNYYEILFEDYRFWNALVRTLMFVASTITVQFFVGLGLALLLNRVFMGRRFVVGALLLPAMIAPVAVGFLWRMLYDVSFGPINYFLYVSGVTSLENPIKWCAAASTSLLSIVLADIWQYTPFMMLILLAGLQAIPMEPYESAKIDGAGRLQVFRYITLPLLRPAIAVAILIRTIDSFKIFDLVYLLTSGGPGVSSDVLSYYTYLNGFDFFRMGYASSLSYLVLMVVMVFTTLYLRFTRRRTS